MTPQHPLKEKQQWHCPPNEVLAGLAELINDETGIATDTVELDKSFTDDLDIDSISMMTIVVNAEEKFDVKIPDEEVKNLKTVGDAVSFIVEAQALELSVGTGGGTRPPSRGSARHSPGSSTGERSNDQEDRRHRIGASSPARRHRPRQLAPCSPASPARTPSTHDWVAELRAARHLRRRGQGAPRRGARAPRDQAPRPVSQFALISAREAWADAGAPEVDPERLGVDYATGIGGLWTLLDAWDTLREKGPRRVLPMTVPDAHAERGRRRRPHAPRRARVRPHRRLGLRLEHRVDRERLRAPAGRARRRHHRRRHRVVHPPASRSPSFAVDAGALASATTTRRPPRARTTSTATASSWARAPPRLVLETEEHALARGAQDLRRDRRRRRHQRLVPHHRPRPRGLGRRARRARGARAGRRDRRRRHPHQRARHQHAGRRHRRVQGAAGACSATGCTTSRCRPPRRRPATCSAAPARSRRSSRSSRCTNRLAPPTINLTDAGPRDPADVVGDAAGRSATARSSRSATRSASAATTPSSRSAVTTLAPDQHGQTRSSTLLRPTSSSQALRTRSPARCPSTRTTAAAAHRAALPSV